MSNIFEADFLFIDLNQTTSLKLELPEHSDNNLTELDSSSLYNFLNSYLGIIKNNQNPLVLNSKLPDEVKRKIIDQVKSSYNNKKLGHVLCTSGTTSTTGIPKCFYFSIDKAINNALAHNKSLDLEGDEKVLFPLPLTHSFGVTVGLWGNLVNRFKTFTYNDIFSISDILSDLKKYQIDIVYLTPSLVRQINKFAKRYKEDIYCPSKISIGSSILFYEDIKQLKNVFPNSQIYYTYGATEMGPRVSTYKLADNPPDVGPIPIGQPLVGVEWKMEGTLKIKSKYSCDQFENNFFDTQDEIQNTKSGPVILGRADDTIIYQGINIYPAEIESQLLSLEGLSEAALIPADSKLHGQVPVLVYSGEIEDNIILSRLRGILPESHIPKKLIKVDDFPKTSLGKIQKKKLKSMLSL